MNVSVNITKKHVTNISRKQLVILSILVFFFISPTEALLLILDECKTELSEILVVILKQDYMRHDKKS